MPSALAFSSGLALVFVLLWLLLEGPALDRLLLASLPGGGALGAAEANLLLSEIKNV